MGGTWLNSLFSFPFKGSVRYFLTYFYFSYFCFSQMIYPSKSMKNVFYFIWKLFSFSRFFIQFFVYFSAPIFFLSVSHWFRGWLKNNLCNISNCINKNLTTHFVWYPEKEIWCDIENLSIDSVKYRTFLWINHADNVNQKLALDFFLIFAK